MANKNRLVEFGLIPLMSTVIGFLTAACVSLLVVQPGIVNQHVMGLSNAHADSIQQQLNNNLVQLRLLLARVTNSYQLAQIVVDNDATARSMKELQIAGTIPHAIKVQIFGLGEAEIDRDAVPAFNFTSLDLVNEAETGVLGNPEAFLSDGRWILSIATPLKIPSDDHVRGTVFVYLEMQSIMAGIEENIEGEMRLTQNTGAANPSEIIVLGTGKAIDAEPLVRNLINPNWTLHYTPSVRIVSETIGSLLDLLIAPLVFLAITLIGVFYGINKTIRFIDTDPSLKRGKLAGVSPNLKKTSDSDKHGASAEANSNEQQIAGDAKSKPVASGDGLVDIKDGEAADDEEIQPGYSSIFRAYDIRGIIDEDLTPGIIHEIGLAIGSEAHALGQQALLVGVDGRLSSSDVRDALIAGLQKSGRDVISIGTVPTPLLYFATHHSTTRSGVMVTGSHNPSQYIGFKIVLDGRTLVDKDIHRLYQRVRNSDFTSGNGNLNEIDVRKNYIDSIVNDVIVAQPLKVVVDCGNGIAGEIIPELLGNLGCDVVPLYCEVDGSFPNHPPDPVVPANLEDLILTVKSQEADLGIALDGDGDRLAAVTKEGEIIWPDRLLMLFAKDIVSRNPGAGVVYDIKCTRHLNRVISGFGGRPILSRSGHSFIKQKMADTDAILGGETSGHICFSERWFGFDDGLYATARLLEIVGSQTESLGELMAEFPSSILTAEIQIEVEEQSKFELVDQLAKNGSFDDATITRIDGIRADYVDGWGLVRASNTTPSIALRFEADNEEAMQRIKDTFRAQLQVVRDDLNFE